VRCNSEIPCVLDKPNEWYQQFHIIVLGLDSLEARSYINAVACSFLEYEEVRTCVYVCLCVWVCVGVCGGVCVSTVNPARFMKIFVFDRKSAFISSYLQLLSSSPYVQDGSPDQATMKPMVDGGTEGFKGHARVILPGVTPCFQCTMW
jgi:molybdopterin/thiamine biosynthesis adenylyltransferase